MKRDLYRLTLIGCACLLFGEIVEQCRQEREELLTEAAQRGCEEFYADQVRRSERATNGGTE